MPSWKFGAAAPLTAVLRKQFRIAESSNHRDPLCEVSSNHAGLRQPELPTSRLTDAERRGWIGKMLRWFHALLPKEERFFELFARQSQTIVAGAEALRTMLEGGESISRHSQEIMEREHEGDNIAREVLLAVRRTFITPFDRRDIVNLISSMDDAIDQMQNTAKVITLFDVRTFDTMMREIADAIVQCARLVDEAVPLLSSIAVHAGRLGTLTEEINRIEGKADELHDRGLKELYQRHGGSDAMAFVIGSQIYDHLEKVVDRFEDVSNEIHGIVIEHV